MKSHVKILVALSLLLLLISLPLFGCSSSVEEESAEPATTAAAVETPATTAAAVETPTATAAEEVETIELSIAFGGPPGHNLVVGMLEPWAAAVEEASNGQVKMIVYAGGALGPDSEQYDMLVTGAADISVFNPGFTAGRFPMSSVIELPGMNPSIEVGTGIIHAMYDKYPEEFIAEYEPVHIINLHGQQPLIIHTQDKPIRTLEDIQGMTIRVTNSASSEAMTLLGGNPVFMGPNDIYTALERGTIDGALYPYEAVDSYGFDEVTSYTTEFALTTIQNCLGMSTNAFNKLPADIQELITTGELGREFLTEHWVSCMNIGQQDGYNIILAKGDSHEIIKLTAEEEARWMETLDPLFDSWVADLDAEGLPGEEALAYALQLKEDLTN